MKISTAALLGILLFLGVDAAAATHETTEATSVAVPILSASRPHKHGGWVKRKKRRVVPAYRRLMRHR
ncbi:hypothetical protein K3G63_19400 [Hymenobacter sp. HSC-4F20]|uniref:hypothetical protein n=1 Tax=Hymenobacter sp. HSC-4F20 TaxID=2864135 RepID=UPI001C737B26|nr:hypothetical protein [Hymenobacter sp. HSC-4F20]MBX0292619.1 hypothetical protein [Hymenobacter sp. HSC-4F20]